MNLEFDQAVAAAYHSNSQRARVMSETWMLVSMYCPCCGAVSLLKFKNNKPVADFHCNYCKEIFELKSKKGKVGKKIAGGAYQAALTRINSNTNPNLIVLQYDKYFKVNSLLFIPKFFFVANTLEKRKPLSQNAKRAGWVGSNILISDIPDQGKLYIIKDGVPNDNIMVVSEYRRCITLNTDNMKLRGWLLDILNCVNATTSDTFGLDEIYKFKGKLQQLHPDNNNIEAKIRQQLQMLRDKGYLDFVKRGEYKKI